LLGGETERVEKRRDALKVKQEHGEDDLSSSSSGDSDFSARARKGTCGWVSSEKRAIPRANFPKRLSPMKSASPLVYLGIGAAIATGALFLMSQSVPPPSPYYSGAYPARKNVVNLFAQFPGGTTILAPGQEFVVYTVPSDRWLTVTACDAFSNTSARMEWGETNGGVFTSKGFADSNHLNGVATSSAYTPIGTEVGWVFAPGSQLVIKNPTTASGNYSLYWYSVTGYLSRE
jgi:hypothetical protein